MEFFSKLPGFTYQYVRYTDWIGQFLHTLTDIDAKDSKKMTKNQKSGLKALNSLYSRYESFLKYGPSSPSSQKEPINDTSEDAQMIDTASPSRLETPMPYMILRAES